MMVKLNNKYIILIFLTVIVLFSGHCFSCKNNRPIQPDESRDTDSLTLIITHDMAHVITLRNDTVFYSVREGHPIGATVQTSHNRDYYENKWPSRKREFDTQRFIDKHRSLLDTISYKDSVRMIVSYDYVYMLYFNGKLVFWEYEEMLEELPKDAQILIREIMKLPGKLYDLPEAYDICRTLFPTSSLYANDMVRLSGLLNDNLQCPCQQKRLGCLSGKPSRFDSFGLSVRRA